MCVYDTRCIYLGFVAITPGEYGIFPYSFSAPFVEYGGGGGDDDDEQIERIIFTGLFHFITTTKVHVYCVRWGFFLLDTTTCADAGTAPFR